MPTFRITIRHGLPHRYEVRDAEVEDLGAAAVLAVAEIAAVDGADLLEIRRLADAEARPFV
jgi:hypothetical protein